MGDDEIEKAIGEISKALGNPEGYNINLLPNDCFYITPQNKNNQSSIERLEIRELDFSILSKHNLWFRNCTFAIKTIFMGTSQPIRFDDCLFHGKIQCDSDIEGGAIFNDTIFENDVFFRHNFEKEANFSNSTFKGKAVFSAEFKGNAHFRNVTFHDACFNDASFQKADFSDAKFLQNADFQSSHFNKQVFFTHSTFQKVSFRGSIFDGNAHFFGAKFHITPDFLQVSFNKVINFTNTELDFKFDEVRKKIEETYQDRKDKYKSEQDKEDKEYKEEPKRYKIANELRDSFRNIKSVLIKDNNMLDASNYHRVELYCKELELEHRNSGLRDFIDKIQLYCYRVTSDHHTDLLLILNNIICLIAWFGCMCFGLSFLHKGYFSINLSDVFKALEILFMCLVFLVISLCFILECYKNFSRDTFKICKLLSKSHSHYNCFRICVIFFSYLIVALILAVKPTLILPIFGQLIDKDSYGNFPAFTSLSIVYAILMFLLIFSLQKTARKNTIVPS